MKIEEIQELWSVDCKLDRTDLVTESLKIPELHNKYFKIYTREKLSLKKMYEDFGVLKKTKWEYYNGKLDPFELKELGWEIFEKKLLKPDVDIYLQSDKDIIQFNLKLSCQKLKVEFLESIIDSLKQRTWNIKNAIEFIKFSQGS